MTQNGNNDPTLKQLKAHYIHLHEEMALGVQADKLRFEQKSVSLRIGINAMVVQHTALVKLLQAKGIITQEEYSAGRWCSKWQSW